MIDQCRRHGIPPPEFEEITDAMVVTFRVHVGQTAVVIPTGAETPQVTPHDAPHVATVIAKLLDAAREPRSRKELQRLVGLKDRRHFQRTYVEPLVARGWLDLTIPGKPKSRFQRYHATAAGLAQLR